MTINTFVNLDTVAIFAALASLWFAVKGHPVSALLASAASRLCATASRRHWERQELSRARRRRGGS
jgi:hypothetical protein